MKIVGNTVGTSLPKSNLMQEDPKKGDFVKGKEEFLGKISGFGVFIAIVRVDRGRYSFINGSHAELLEAYGKQAAVMLNVNGYLYYLANLDGDNILHFGQIPYSNSDSETVNITNYYLMVAPDNSIAQTVRHIATEGFVNDAIQKKIPDDLAPPTVTVEQTEDGAVISITDKNGTTEATICNGKDGVDGKDGSPGADGRDGKTPVKGVDYFTPDDIEEVAAMAAAKVEVPEGGGGEYVEWEEIINRTNIAIDEPVTEIVFDLPRRYREYWFICAINNNLELESYSNSYKYGAYFDVDGFRANPYDMFNTTGATSWWTGMTFQNIPYSLISQGANNQNNLAETKAAWLTKAADAIGKFRIAFGRQTYRGSVGRLQIMGRYPIE